MADDDIAVVVEPDTETKAPDVVVTNKDPADDLAAQYKELEARQRADEQRATAAEQRATAAEHKAAEAGRQVQGARVEIVDSRLDTILSGISAAETEASSAEAEYQRAMEAGDFAGSAKAQRKMAAAEARKIRLDEAKADLEVSKQLETQRAAQPQRQAQPQYTDPVEAFIASADRPPQTQRWLREHRDFVTDPQKQKKLNAAHMDADAEGIEINSPEYFAHVNNFLGLSETNGTQQRQAPTPPARRRASVPVAPVNATTGGNGGSGNEVRLSAREAQSAQDGTVVWNTPDPTGKGRWKVGDPVGVQEFARRKQKMMADGVYDKSVAE